MTGHQEATTGKSSGKQDGARVAKRNDAAKRNGLVGAVDRGTRTVERLHRAIAGWPLDALERVGRLEKPVARVRKLQERSIRAGYAFVRGVNHEVAQLVRDTSGRKRTHGQRGSTHRVARAKPKKAEPSEPVARAS